MLPACVVFIPYKYIHKEGHDDPSVIDVRRSDGRARSSSRRRSALGCPPVATAWCTTPVATTTRLELLLPPTTGARRHLSLALLYSLLVVQSLEQPAMWVAHMHKVAESASLALVCLVLPAACLAEVSHGRQLCKKGPAWGRGDGYRLEYAQQRRKCVLVAFTAPSSEAHLPFFATHRRTTCH